MGAGTGEAGSDGVPGDAAPRLVRFTVDVEGDWAGTSTRGIDEALPRLVDLLDRHGATATFFVVGDLIDRVRPALEPDGPHEVGSHGLTHRTLTSLAPAEVVEEVVGSRAAIQAAGYRVAGFRAPFFARPAGFGRVLADAGYGYDASIGSVLPFRRPAPADEEPLPVVPSGHLRDRRTPCSLTTLRIAHPHGVRLVGDDPQTFTCHLHELLDGSPGWTALPPGLRHLHRRGAGRPAWEVLEALLARPDLRFTSCRDHLHAVGSP
ncbi:polysaccharide deacetylase family protein [Aquihabitans daechungensis]|uniref:polysaccharide deacetylase family protein n=1 Tax=Aquihabitans daechungensis TaxID=1052257 RepID=UPI003B9E6DBD